MLRAAETIERTDTGRQRRGNEDSSFARPPVFVVADGMGGAQAGEVASQIAVQAFEEGLPEEGTPEERLVSLAQAANQRIYELSQSERERAGMGTTLTAAYLDDAHVAIAHVGDSRAYLFRDGHLTRLTQDHSLVDELVRRGKLTEEQALEHPQRSIITRALGPEPVVEVDTFRYPVQSGDVLLLCSDGLTSMLPEERISEILGGARSLRGVADQLIDEANEAGGRDNITVILFRLEDVGGGLSSQPTVLASTIPPVESAHHARSKTILSLPDPEEWDGDDDSGEGGDGDGGGTRAKLAAPPVAKAPPVVTRPKPATRSAPAVRRAPLARLQGHANATARPRRERHFGRLGKTVAALCAIVAVLFVIGGGGYLATRQLYFVGTNSRGIVTIYRGLPYELPLGARLYETFYVSGVPAARIPNDRRAKVLDHHLRSQSDATKLIRELELGQLSG